MRDYVLRHSFVPQRAWVGGFLWETCLECACEGLSPAAARVHALHPTARPLCALARLLLCRFARMGWCWAVGPPVGDGLPLLR